MIQRIYLFVNEDLSLKDKGGYSSNSEFNRALNYAENLLYSFYVQKFEKDNIISDSLSPFVKNATLNIVNGSAAIPDDYRHRIEFYINRIDNDSCEAHSTKIGAMPIGLNEEATVTDSVLRRPSLKNKRLFYFIEGNSIKILPNNLSGSATFKYLKDFTPGERKVTYNQEAVDEIYDSNNSVNLEWREQDESRLIDILLYLKGVQIRDQ